MESILYYLLRASVVMVLFYSIYRLFFSHNTFHTANRFLLLWMQLMIFVLPLFHFNFLPEQETTMVHNFLSVDYENLSKNPMVSDQSTLSIPWVKILFPLIVIGFLFTVIRYLIGLAQIITIIRTAEKQTLADNTVLCVTDKAVAPFSWMRNVVITRAELSDSNETIIRHEKAHRQLHHSFDMILFDLFTAVFWFNPFSWLMRQEMQSIHEYQADEQVLRQGVDTKQYQLLLIRKSAGEFKFALANNFRQRDLHKRIKMMKKNKTHRQMRWIYAMVLPALFLGMTLLSVPTLNAKSTQTLLDEIIPDDSTKVEIRVIGYAKMDSTSSKKNPIFIVNGKKVTSEELNELQPEEIKAITVIKDKIEAEMYGEDGRDGVIVIKTKKNGVDGDASEIMFSDTTKGTVRVLIDTLNENSQMKVRKLASSNPLFIVDGEKMTSDFRLNTIDPKDIESISVLKDKAAVELYGENAKEGVIIITRKKKEQ